MPLKTLEVLRARAKEHADKVKSQFVSDPVWNGWINESAAELWDLIVSANEDYETISVDFSITSGNTRALPSDFYFIRGLDKESGGQYRPVRRYKFEERGFFQSDIGNDFYHPDVVYRVIKDQIIFLPPESAPGNYRLWYIPVFPELVSDTDQLEGRNSWDTFITLGAAIFAKAKAEEDFTDLKTLKDAALKRILFASSSRDKGEPAGIVRTSRRALCQEY